MICPQRMETDDKLQDHVAGRSASSLQREQRANMRLQHTAVYSPLPSTACRQKGSKRRGRASDTAPGVMPAAQSPAGVMASAPDMIRLSADMPGLTLRVRDSVASRVDGQQCGTRRQWNLEGTPDIQELSTGTIASRASGMATETQGQAAGLKGEPQHMHSNIAEC